MLFGNFYQTKKCKHKGMKIYSFFKLVNKKITEYDKAVSNPFVMAHTPVTIVWVEDFCPDKKNDNKN